MAQKQLGNYPIVLLVIITWNGYAFVYSICKYNKLYIKMRKERDEIKECGEKNMKKERVDN